MKHLYCNECAAYKLPESGHWANGDGGGTCDQCHKRYTLVYFEQAPVIDAIYNAVKQMLQK